MKTVIVPANSPDAITQAIEVLNRGGLVAFPTDTVYGVGSLVFDGKAVESIYAAKDRPVEKAIPVLIADAADMEKVGTNIPAVAQQLAHGVLERAGDEVAKAAAVVGDVDQAGVRERVADEPRVVLRLDGAVQRIDELEQRGGGRRPFGHAAIIRTNPRRSDVRAGAAC